MGITNNKGKKKYSKEIMITVSEIMLAKPTSNSCSVDSTTRRYISRNKELFGKLEEKNKSVNNEYIWKTTNSAMS